MRSSKRIKFSHLTCNPRFESLKQGHLNEHVDCDVAYPIESHFSEIPDSEFRVLSTLPTIFLLYNELKKGLR